MPSSSWARRCAALVLALVVLPATSVLLAACQLQGDPSASPERISRNDAQATLSSHPVETRTRIHRVFGRLPDARRKAVRVQVGKVVDRWWEASYLGGTYPRASFPGAFPGFTAAAEERARSAKALLTNETQGQRLDSVTAKHRSIALDVLATDRRARSVTASFVLRFETDGEVSGTTTVRGRLFLVSRGGHWRIFGYDVAKGSTR